MMVATSMTTMTTIRIFRHAIGLVEDEVAHIPEVAHALVGEILEAAEAKKALHESGDVPEAIHFFDSEYAFKIDYYIL